MLEGLVDFFVSNHWTILFYTAIILLVYLNRSRFEIQDRIVALYRTKYGINIMERAAKKSGELIKLLGYIGIGVGFSFMIYIVFYLIQNLWTILTEPAATSGVSVVLPGVNVPGAAIQIPLISGWIALFVVMVVHEFSHGLVAKSHGLTVKSTGIAFFGPIMGAFVEPDEKKLAKASDVAQYSVFAAGPFSNILLSLLVFAVLGLLLSPVFYSISTPVGFSVTSVMKGLPADQAHLPVGVVFTMVNGEPVNGTESLDQALRLVKPGDTIHIATATETYTLTATSYPGNESRAYIGVNIKDEYASKPQYSLLSLLQVVPILAWINEFLWLLGILSIGIGTVNLLPIGPIDGGRMMFVALEKTMGKVKGTEAWKKVTIACLLILVLNIALSLLLPLFR